MLYSPLMSRAAPVRRAYAATLGLIAALAFAFAGAQTLPLAPQLIGLDSAAGEKLLLESEARQAYLPLSIHFVTQKTQSYCAIASMVMVLNALGVPAPTTPLYAPYHIFTQDNVLNEKTERILPQAVLARRGTTLDQLGAMLASLGVETTVTHASDVSFARFRAEAVAYLSRPRHYVVVNYLRRELGQGRGGHVSPLAAYDAKTDRFLILDVARYKYPPVWVRSAELYAAMDTPDSDNGNRSRGYVLITRPAN
jgi:hypothetical protein